MNLTDIVNKETGFFRKIRRGALYTILSAALSLGAIACKDDTPGSGPVLDKIASPRSRDENWDIYVMNADGTNPKRLTNYLAFDVDPVWSPDGTKIAFVSYRDGNGEIYVMNADGTKKINITNNPARDGNPDWK